SSDRYKKATDKTTSAAVNQAMKDFSVDIRDLILNNPQDKVATLAAIKKYILNKTGAVGEDADILVASIDAKWTDIINSKNIALLESLIKEQVKKAPPSSFIKLRQALNLGAYSSDRYKKATDKTTSAAVNQAMKDFSTGLAELITRSNRDKTNMLRDITNYIMARSHVPAAEAELLAMKIKDKYNALLRDRTEKHLASLLKEKPARIQISLIDAMTKLLNMKEYTDRDIGQIVQDKFGIYSLTEADQRDIMALGEAMQDNEIPDVDYASPELVKWFQEAKEVADKGYADFQDMLAAKFTAIIMDRLPASNRQKWRTLQRISMLSNPKTHIRSVVGNAEEY
ncbi:MAG: hypothetical protein RR387_06220, partial [Clostridiales bacterium]